MKAFLMLLARPSAFERCVPVLKFEFVSYNLINLNFATFQVAGCVAEPAELSE